MCRKLIGGLVGVVLLALPSVGHALITANTANCGGFGTCDDSAFLSAVGGGPLDVFLDFSIDRNGNATAGTVDVAGDIFSDDVTFSSLNSPIHGGINSSDVNLGAGGSIASEIGPASGFNGTFVIEFANPVEAVGFGTVEFSTNGTITVFDATNTVIGVFNGVSDFGGDYFGLVTTAGEQISRIEMDETFQAIQNIQFNFAQLLQETTTAVEQEIIKETSEAQTRAEVRTIVGAITRRIAQIRTAFRARTRAKGASGGAGLEKLEGLSAWADVSLAVIDNRASATRFTGNNRTGLVGIDFFPTERTIVGAVVSLDVTDYDLLAQDGQLDAFGQVLTVYGSVQINDNYSVNIYAGVGHAANDIEESSTGAEVDGDYDSYRYLVGGAVVGQHQLDSWLVTGSAGIVYAGEDFENYTASDGSRVRPETTELGQLSFGIEFAYDAETYMPYAAVSYEYDFEKSGDGDPNGVLLGFGVRVTGDEQWSGGVFTNFEALRDREDIITLGANLRYVF